MSIRSRPFLYPARNFATVEELGSEESGPGRYSVRLWKGPKLIRIYMLTGYNRVGFVTAMWCRHGLQSNQEGTMTETEPREGR